MCGSFNLFLVVKEANISSSATTDQLVLSFKQSEMIGTASCAIADGNKIIAQYGDSLKLSKGLRFEMYRFKSTERYETFIEITVYENSKPPKK